MRASGPTSAVVASSLLDNVSMSSGYKEGNSDKFLFLNVDLQLNYVTAHV